MCFERSLKSKSESDLVELVIGHARLTKVELVVFWHAQEYLGMTVPVENAYPLSGTCSYRTKKECTVIIEVE